MNGVPSERSRHAFHLAFVSRYTFRSFKLPLPVATIISNRYVRLLLLIVAVGICVWTIKTTATFAVSRLLVKYSIVMRNNLVAEKATQLTPNDPQAHRAHGVVLGMLNSPEEAAIALERAVALRPADYLLWIALGQARERLGDNPGATMAFNEAVNHAQFYANPRWQRGNFLLRTGQYESAFADLNQAARSKPELVPNLIDLAWSLSKGDPKLTEEIAQIKTPRMRLEFARVLMRHGKAQEAMEQYRSAGAVPDEVKREVLTQLMEKSAFREAFEIWKQDHETSGTLVNDGGFEKSLSLSEAAFGWRVASSDLKTVSLSQDPNEPHNGAKSLRVDFAGDLPTNVAVLSQLIPVEPSKTYVVTFAARSEDIVTGGLPVAVVTDATGARKRLAVSSPLSQGSADWQMITFEFTTEPETKAVTLGIERESCTTSPCPIFGSISLDSFSVQLK